MLCTFVDATNVGKGPPLADEAWHAACQAICMGVEGSEWEMLCYKFVERNKAATVRHPNVNHTAKTLWKVREAEETGDAYYDQDSEQQIVGPEAVRQAPWDTQLLNAGS